MKVRMDTFESTFTLRMRELSGSGQQISDAVIGAVGPKYINILVPSQKAHTLESYLHDYLIKFRPNESKPMI